MLISPNAISAVSEILDASMFYRESHAKIYRAALALDERSEPVDAITLTAELEARGELDDAGGRVRIQELAHIVPASANAAHYARIVKEKATWRALIRSGGETARLGWEQAGDPTEAVDQAQQIAFALGDAKADGAERIDSIVKGTFQRLTDMYESGGAMTGLATGFRDIDRLTQGFEPGNLIILAGRPSMGKSALVTAFMANIAVRQKRPVGLFTAEMSKDEVSKRLIAREAHVDLRSMKGTGPKPSDWPLITNAVSKLIDAPLYVDDTGVLRLSYVRSVTRKLLAQHPDLALIVVDYLQLMTGDGENRTQEVSKLSRGLKILARELSLPVIVLSQLSRKCEERVNKRPMLSDLRESGSIEQDADIVAFLYRDEYYNEDSDQQGLAEFIVAKNRNGPTEMVKLSYQKREASFSDLAGAWT